MSRLLPLLAAGELGFTPSNYMPAFKVEVAFTSGYNTAAADRVWTDVSDYVELADQMGGDHGRQDERSTADANTWTLVLDNTDGRFTAGRSASPYYPNVKIGRPVRVSLMTVTGHTSVRFVGFIDEWPVEWDGTDAYAKASVRATSRLARLGLSTKLRSMPEQEILTGRPLFYWTMGDPTDSTSAAESSGNAGPRLGRRDPDGGGAPVVFGNATGPGTDGLTAAEFTGSQSVPTSEFLTILDGTTVPAGPRTIRAAVRLRSVPPTFTGYFVICGFGIGVNTSGVLVGGVTTGPSMNDGATHDVALVRDGATERLYLDGVEVDSAAAGNAPLGGGTVGSLDCVVAHAAVYERALSAAEVAAQAEAMLGTAERTDERLVRVLGWAGVASSEITTDTGSETMTYQLTSGQSVVDALRDVESTESGVLFDGRDGNVVFHNRSRRYTATPAATLDMAAQHVGADYAPKLDRSTLVNSAEVDNPTTGETARYTDTASIDEYGVASTSAKCVATTSDPLLQKAAWLVFSYAEPRPRVPSLTVDVLAHVGATPSAEDLLALNVGDLIEVVNQPTQADATTAQYFIEGYSEAIGPESYSITFNLSPSHPSLSTFVLDDPVRGQLDSGFVLGL